MVSFKHLFTSAKADGGDSTLVKPSNWNAEHEVKAAADGIVLGVPAGAGPNQPVQELPISNVFPPGFVSTFAGATAPTGWLICDGSLHNRADLPALFTAIGTAYNTGGEATTQFRIPDCRGRVIAGVDGGAGRLGNYVGPNLGNAGGTEVGNVVVNSGGVNNFNFGNINLVGGYASPSGAEVAAAASGNGASARPHDHSVSGYVPVNGNFGVNVSGSANFNNMPPVIVMNQMIKT